MPTRNHHRQYVVVRFITSHPVTRHNIVYASVDYDSVQAYCNNRNAKKEAHEEYIVMNRHDYELAYGEKA